EPAAAHDLSNAADQRRREAALIELVADFFGLGRLENVVKIRQQCPQGQSHRISPILVLVEILPLAVISVNRTTIPCTIQVVFPISLQTITAECAEERREPRMLGVFPSFSAIPSHV